jgi:cytochrome c-type biogenesis protein CcmH
MWLFLLVAAVMAVIAAAAVAVPLLRDRRSRVQGGIAALAVLAVAAGLYPLWSTWDWNAPAAGGPDVAAMVAKLEKHLGEQPDDLDGWLMLGRSYTALSRIDEAIVAYDHAHRLDDGKNVEAALGLGEALSIKADGEVTPQAAQLFEQAIAEAPDNPRALLFGGFAAAVSGDRPLARSRWEALKAQHPPPQVVQMLDARIAELGTPPAGMVAGASPAPGASAPGSATSGSGAAPQFSAQAAPAGGGSDAAVPVARATVNVTIAPALKARLTADAPLFVFARDATPGPPLAAKRLSIAAIGTRIELSSADAMMPTHALASGQRVSITARVSFSGQPTPVAGDLYGEISYDVGHDGVRDLVIDRVAP